MTTFDPTKLRDQSIASALPKNSGMFIDGGWQKTSGGQTETYNPGTGELLGLVDNANRDDVNKAIESAHRAFQTWRHVSPIERGDYLKKVAQIMRNNKEELALIDSANSGNPVADMERDVLEGARQIEYYAGLGTEVKGDTIPMGPDVVNMTIYEPRGVCVRILAYNHPLMFAAIKLCGPLITGNTCIIKPAPQAPLSTIRLFELIEGVLPPGVLNLVSGGLECGQALTEHPLTPSISLVGSVGSGVAVAKSAADRLKHVVLELGGKNAMAVYPDANIEETVKGAIMGMNFGWCGQSCGSTSRLFLHEDIYDAIFEGILNQMDHYQPGIQTERATTMGSLISRPQLDKVLRYIDIGKSDGAKLAYGGEQPTEKKLKDGFFVKPTIFSDVNQSMRIANEEVFGPILAVLKWTDEDKLYEQINSTEFGLTGSIFTSNLSNANRGAARIESGYIWVNTAAPHYIGAPFGGYKMSGVGREGSIAELYDLCETKNVHMSLI